MPTIKVRFSNPQYNASTKKYKLDCEFQSDTSNKQLFGMNVRLHYDATKLLPGTNTNGKVNLVDFAPGYGMQSKAGCQTSTAGIVLFGLTTAPMTYLNWAIQLNSVSEPPVYISTSGWTKLFAIETETPQVLGSGTEFCPVFIWDIQDTNGGYASPNAKIEITTVRVLGSSSGSTTTEPCTERAEHWNWVDNTGTTRPYGIPNTSNCLTV